MMPKYYNGTENRAKVCASFYSGSSASSCHFCNRANIQDSEVPGMVVQFAIERLVYYTLVSEVLTCRRHTIVALQL